MPTYCQEPKILQRVKHLNTQKYNACYGKKHLNSYMMCGHDNEFSFGNEIGFDSEFSFGIKFEIEFEFGCGNKLGFECSFL